MSIDLPAFADRAKPYAQAIAQSVPQRPQISPTAFLVFKLALYAVFVHNAIVFGLTHETATAAVEGFAWIALIGVVEWELTREEDPNTSMNERVLVHGINIFCHLVILYTTVQFALEGEWRDVINSSTWLGVSAVLYWEAYVPGADQGRSRKVLNGMKTVLYGTLGVIACVWSLDPTARLEAADAWLWIIAFAVIELDILGLGEEEE
ncbi:MAG: hypothetical protein AAFR17_08830 [Pseudomonadota bacterium]